MNPASAPAGASASAPLAGTAAGGGAELWSSLLVTALALAFVLALAWLFLRLLKRVTSLRTADGRLPPQVVQAVSLGNRERVIVLRHGGAEYLLGVTANQITLLDKQAAATAPPATDPSINAN